ncbi:MAG: adenine deaminase C-terminal domain-containing protein, partial [Desulfovibrionaceae bacterium]|nr:adenine deaminase C-terminal domain-containing protein [Desulfovibrionaceae bacterium]
LPGSVFFMASSCVPATHRETSGAEISASDIAGLFKRHPDRVLGLAEVMNFPGVLAGRPEVLAKIAAAGPRPVDGHAPLLSGRDLCAYVLAGPGSEHEASGPDEAREKLRAGMHLMIREGSTEHNLADLVPVVNEFNSCRVSLVSDDRSAGDLMRLGHMDHSLRLAMAHGVPPMRAVQMASVNTARYFGLRGRGAVAPGYRADFLLLDDLEEFSISEVFLAGRNVRDLDFPPGRRRGLKKTMNVSGLCPESFCLAPGRGRIRVIGFSAGQVITESLVLEPRLVDGRPEADPSRDLAKLAVIERHQGSGKVGLGFVHGLGLVQGALASTVAHDSHNLIVAGVKDKDMLAAARECVRMGGGLAAAAGGRVLASLALPIAGLMSDRPLSEVARGFDAVLGAARDLCPGLESPFAALSFLALPVIPFLKLTDQGLVDVAAFDFTDLWVD